MKVLQKVKKRKREEKIKRVNPHHPVHVNRAATMRTGFIVQKRKSSTCWEGVRKVSGDVGHALSFSVCSFTAALSSAIRA